MSLANSISKQEIVAATDQCVMCGLCLPHCPTYTIGQTEAESPRGRIALVRALYEEKLEVSDTISSHLDHCLTCMKCESVCPANVDYEKIIDAGRAFSNTQSSLFKHFQQSILLFTLAKPGARKVAKTFISIFKAINLQRLLSNYRLFNLLPESKQVISRTLTKTSASNAASPKVTILNSCAGDLVNDEAQAATTLILSKLGCDVLEPEQTLCCGALHQHTGDLKTAKELRNNFIHSINLQNPDFLVSPATGCGAQIKRYSELSDDSSEQLNTQLFDVNEFVLQKIKQASISFKPLAKKVYLHQPCSHAQVVNDATVVAQLLKFIPELEVTTFKDKLACCGAGGMNTITHSELANQLIDGKASELKNSDASYLLSSNIGCALHFQAKLRHEGIHVQVLHPITLLAQQMV